MSTQARRGSVGSTEEETDKAWVVRARLSLQRSEWYYSPTAVFLRRCFTSVGFISVMATGLLFALFLVDVWVMAGANDNTVPNLVLTFVLLMFTCECIGLCMVDAAYLLSFFFFMDIVGTVSMIWDIPWLLGVDATLPTQASSAEAGGQGNLMLLRALRASRVAARAGRLSRVARLLQFVPLMGGVKDDDGEKIGIASMISGQLASLLASRVAALTLVLAMAIPLTDVWTFPQHDYSMQTWVNKLSANMAAGRTNDTLKELKLMTDFYSQFEYGPYLACLGSVTDDVFRCAQDGDGFPAWRPLLAGPHREASALQVYTDTFMIGFNMQEPAVREAGLSFGGVVVVILAMVFSGLALSSVVNQLAVRPLERMLSIVRKIALTAFKISADVNEQDEEDVIDINNASEMNLLEKVVQKLAIITELRTHQAIPESTEDLRNEDIGILNMMHGGGFMASESKRTESEGRRSSSKISASSSVLDFSRIGDTGVTQDLYESWAFQPLGLTRDQQLLLTQYAMIVPDEKGLRLFQTPDEAKLLQRFLQAVKSGYKSREQVAFHNFAHAVDVVHSVGRFLHSTDSHRFLSPQEQFSLLVSAVAHDVGHLGRNNGFLSEVGHELAIRYNDRSPLENMHCATLFEILTDPHRNIHASLKKEERREVRNVCIQVILHTDMTLHGPMVKDLQVLFEVNSEVLAERDEDWGDVFSGKEVKPLVLNSLLHACDIANPCKEWRVSEAWAHACLDEFFAQGDEEKRLGIPVQFLNDRDKLNRPNSQIGFIEFMIFPLFTAMVQLWPSLSDLHENLCCNMEHWKDLWVQETSPGGEERGRVEARVAKVKDSLKQLCVALKDG